MALIAFGGSAYSEPSGELVISRFDGERLEGTFAVKASRAGAAGPTELTGTFGFTPP